MSNAVTFRQTIERYCKARIPFVSIRTPERMRALEIIRDVREQLNIPVYVHTLSRGMRDLQTGRCINEDRSVPGALDFISTQLSQRQNLTYILTEVTDIEDDNPISRQLQDVATLAAEQGGMVCLITTKPVFGQLQRLGMAVVLDSPDEDEMATIIRESVAPYRAQMTVEWGDQEEREAAAILNGLTRIEAENVIATLLANGAVRKSDLVELTQAKDRIFSDISGIERITVRQPDLCVGGLGGLRRWLENERPLLTADLRDRGIRPPRGVLLVGVPGCGKSLSAKAISSSWSLPLYRLDLATIQGQYLGQSEGRLKEALGSADHVAPCILWIDEIEKGLAGATSGGDGGTSARLVGQFLFWLQESTSRVFVVATANDVSRLPPELLRRGRFDELFFVDLPTAEERQEIIQIYAERGLKRRLESGLVGELVSRSEGFAGADLEAAVRQVVKAAFLHGDDVVTSELFLNSFADIVPLSKTSPEQIEAIRAWGRERAVPASGIPIAGTALQARGRRGILV